jgi:hypothetical protein
MMNLSCLSFVSQTVLACARIMLAEGRVNQPDVSQMDWRKAAARYKSGCPPGTFFVRRKRTQEDASVMGMNYDCRRYKEEC